MVWEIVETGELDSLLTKLKKKFECLGGYVMENVKRWELQFWGWHFFKCYTAKLLKGVPECLYLNQKLGVVLCVGSQM